MASDVTTPLPERVASAYSKLFAVASELNTVSDELGKTIEQIDTALKKLNLGVTVWITIERRPADPPNDNFWDSSDRLGYAKIRGKWGIALQTIGEDIRDPNQDSCEEWPFNEAPRRLRLLAIDKISELLDGLAQVAVKTKDQIQERLKDAQAVADAVTKASGGRIPLRGIQPPPKVGQAGAK